MVAIWPCSYVLISYIYVQYFRNWDIFAKSVTKQLYLLHLLCRINSIDLLFMKFEMHEQLFWEMWNKYDTWNFPKSYVVYSWIITYLGWLWELLVQVFISIMLSFGAIKWQVIPISISCFVFFWFSLFNDDRLSVKNLISAQFVLLKYLLLTIVLILILPWFIK